MIVIASSCIRLTSSHNSLQVGSISQPISRRSFTAARADDGGSPGCNNSGGGQHDFGTTAIRTSSMVREWRRIPFDAATGGDCDVGGATAPSGRQLINNISKKVSSLQRYPCLPISSVHRSLPSSSSNAFALCISGYSCT